MSFKIKSSFTPGEVTVPKSKSEAIRAVFASVAADKITEIYINADDISNDISDAISAAEELGCRVNLKDGLLKIFPLKAINPSPVFDCRESAAVLRFLIPLCSVLSGNGAFGGSESLAKRDNGDFFSCLKDHEITFSSDKLPFEINGILHGGVYEINAGVSSQYISALLMSLPFCKEDSEIITKGESVSVGYIDMTVDMLRRFSVDVVKTERGYKIKGAQKYISPEKITLGGDWSAAANYLALGAVHGGVKIKGLDLSSAQPDKIAAEIISKMGASVSYSENALSVNKSSLKAVAFDMSGCPDIVPAMSVAAAFANGTSEFKNVSRLKNKESDRITSVIEMLGGFDINAYCSDGSLFVQGGKPRFVREINTYHDHRIAMASCIMALACGEDAYINDCDCCKKSYVSFTEDIKRFGGELYEI